MCALSWGVVRAPSQTITLVLMWWAKHKHSRRKENCSKCHKLLKWRQPRVKDQWIQMQLLVERASKPEKSEQPKQAYYLHMSTITTLYRLYSELRVTSSVLCSCLRYTEYMTSYCTHIHVLYKILTGKALPSLYTKNNTRQQPSRIWLHIMTQNVMFGD